jgi:hypothetical protein
MAATGTVLGKAREGRTRQSVAIAAVLAVSLWGVGFVAGRAVAPDVTTSRIAPASNTAVHENVGPASLAFPDRGHHHRVVKGG